MPSVPKRRPDQVAEVVRQILAETLLRDVRDPRIGLVTITRVTVSGDLSHARVGVIVHGEETEWARALEGLQSAAGFLRSRVAKALAIRTTPELHFEIDRGQLHAARIDAMLADLKREAED